MTFSTRKFVKNKVALRNWKKKKILVGNLGKFKKKNGTIEKISLKRIASTNEIADIILFLASEKSSYINGQNIVADGGNLWR